MAWVFKDPRTHTLLLYKYKWINFVFIMFTAVFIDFGWPNAVGEVSLSKDSDKLLVLRDITLHRCSAADQLITPIFGEHNSFHSQ